MQEKFTIRELAIYYVQKYDLDIDCNADTHGNYGNMLRNYITQISRILKKTSIGEKTLWDSIKSRDSSRRISIGEFEQYCFGEWSDYIEKNCRNYNISLLKQDKEKYLAQKDVQYWKDKTQEVSKAYDELAKQNGSVPDGGKGREKSSPEVYQMMLKALYDLFFEPFNQELYEQDLKDSQMSVYANPELLPDIESAKERLSDYNNYIERKEWVEEFLKHSRLKNN